MTAINTTLSKLFFGVPQNHKALTMFPLLQSDAVTLGYVTLDEALAKGAASVTEISEAGSVPQLKLVNSGEEPILLLDGDELVGAKQNRVLNMSILAPGKSELVIPVSCVEAGRWNYRSRNFASAGRVQFNRGRAKKVASVSASIKMRRTFSSDQSEVWGEIEEKLLRMRSPSPTNAMSDIYEDYEARLEAYLEGFKPEVTQVGAVLFIGQTVAGMDLFDNPATYTKLWHKLLRSYALDAIEMEEEQARQPTPQDAVDWLEAIKKSAKESHPSVGLGVSTRIEDPRVVGAALEVEDQPIHVYAAPVMA